MCEQQFDWVPAQGGEIPPHAVVGGKTSDGEDLYIGRAYHEGSQTVGKVIIDQILNLYTNVFHITFLTQLYIKSFT